MKEATDARPDDPSAESGRASGSVTVSPFAVAQLLRHERGRLVPY